MQPDPIQQTRKSSLRTRIPGLRPRIPGLRTRIPRTAIIICAVIVAIAGSAAAAWKISHHPPTTLQHATCGSATTHFLTDRTQILAADRGALTCFGKAARTCTSASLRVTEMGVDTGTDYVFIIKPGTASCQVTEQSQYYSANFGGSQGAVRTVQCHRILVPSGGVTLRCNGRDLLIPAKVSKPFPLSA
jgi:hypothetical protein